MYWCINVQLDDAADHGRGCVQFVQICALSDTAVSSGVVMAVASDREYTCIMCPADDNGGCHAKWLEPTTEDSVQCAVVLLNNGTELRLEHVES